MCFLDLGCNQNVTAAVLSICGCTSQVPKWYPKYCNPPSNPTLLWVSREPHPPQEFQDRGCLPHMLRPVVTEDDDVIQISGNICSMQAQHLVLEVLESDRVKEQPIWSGEGHFFLTLRRQGNLLVAPV